MCSAFRKMVRLIGEGRRGRWALLVVLACFVTLLEILGAVLIFLLLGMIADPGGELTVPFLGDLRAHVDTADTTFLLAVTAILAVFFLVRAVVQVGFGYVRHRLARNAAARVASRLTSGYLRMPYTFHLRRNSAELVRTVQQSADRLADECFLPAIYVVADGILVLGLLTMLLFIAPLPTGLAVLIIGAAALLLLKVIQPRLQAVGSTAHEYQKQTQSVLQQSLHGVRDVKLLGVEDSFTQAYELGRFRWARAAYVWGALSELPRATIETALLGFILALFTVGIIGGSPSDELLATLGLFAYAGLRMQTSVQKIVGGLNSIRYAQAALDQVDSDLTMIEGWRSERGEDEVELTFHGKLRMEAVGFSYEGASRPALSDVDVTVMRGEMIGICGPTGGGKTTLTDLITGILEPSQGRVTVDGIKIQSGLKSWYRKLGVVPQMVFLSDDTLRRNIALGQPDDQIDEESLALAVQLSQLGEFVAALPLGLDTVVGERGIRVSGGQRQRVAIARALYRRPEVLVFDEGTSALDTLTESELMSSLERLHGQHTLIIVAHRLSTVRNCDRILYIADGVIQGEGSYDQLIAMHPGFRALTNPSST
jgi:ATP-binding cassette, subfamily B, bacterial PglK